MAASAQPPTSVPVPPPFLPPVAEPPRVTMPAPVLLPKMAGAPDDEENRRRHPRAVSAWVEGQPEARRASPARWAYREQAIVWLPGVVGSVQAHAWTGFWLELEFHPSRAGQTIRATWINSPGSWFLTQGAPVARLDVVIDPRGIVRLPVSLDADVRDALLAVSCQGRDTRVHLGRRLPSVVPR